MNLEKYLAVSGEHGLFELVASRQNGLVLKNIQSGKKRFYPMRRHNFTPLGTIGIFTDTDTIPLSDVFERMAARKPIISPDEEAEDVRAWFIGVAPEHDEDQVSIKDIRKIIKWFNILNESNLLDGSEEE